MSPAQKTCTVDCPLCHPLDTKGGVIYLCLNFGLKEITPDHTPCKLRGLDPIKRNYQERRALKMVPLRFLIAQMQQINSMDKENIDIAKLKEILREIDLRLS